MQDKLIELFQEWALLLQSDPALAYLYDTYTNLKNTKRVFFPIPSKGLDQFDPFTIVSSSAPPDWSDSPTCHRCRDTFTLTNRKHHCRKCGNTFCQLCSSNETLLLDMGISDPVRVCDACYREPSHIQQNQKEKRTAKIFESSRPSEDDLELKKAIELSLKESKAPFNLTEDDESLKKAIEASLKESGPSHISPQSTTVTTASSSNSTSQSNRSRPPIPVINFFNSTELENISMFHQLIGRLVRTRPSLTPEDAVDIKKLAEEMRRLRSRPIESDEIKLKLDESLRGFEILFNTAPLNSNVINKQSQIPLIPTLNNNFQTQTAPSDVSRDLNRIRNEMFGSEASEMGSEGIVRSRLGSLSLERQILEQPPNIQRLDDNFQASIPVNYLPEKSTQMSHQNSEDQFMKSQNSDYLSVHSYPQTLHVQQSLNPQIQSSYSIPLSQQQSHYLQNPLNSLQNNFTNIPCCQEMTIHPHPVHSVMQPTSIINPFENPYANAAATVISEEVNIKNSKSSPKKKKKKKSKEKDKEKEEEKKSKTEHKLKKNTKKKHKNISDDEEESDDENEKRMKPKKENKQDVPKKEDTKTKFRKSKTRKSSESNLKGSKESTKDNNEDNLKFTRREIENEIQKGKKSPINLIDL